MAERRRQGLSNLGGRTESRGDPAFCVPLVAAFEAASEADAQDAEHEREAEHDRHFDDDDDASEPGPAPSTRALATDAGPLADSRSPEREPIRGRDDLTHGFHAYPARMHPAIAQLLLRELAIAPRPTVLDPFCGSGTVAVEAMLAGWRSLGSDLDPLALRLARVKTHVTDARARERFLDLLEQIGEASERRVRERVDVWAELPAEERAWYDVHVLKELAGLLAEIRRVREGRQRLALEMVFSAIVVKFSRQRAETAQRTSTKRIRKGLPTEFFVRKGRELVERWAALASLLPERPQLPRFVLSDARTLPNTLAGEFRCDLVLCSPPYGGTYDYAHHHARRHAWLGIGSSDLREREIGARRHLSRARSARERWDRELHDVLVSLRELMNDEAVMVLLIGDAELAGERVPADRQIERLAERAELELVAVASQPRQDWRGGPPRAEHLLALQPRHRPHRRASPRRFAK